MKPKRTPLMHKLAKRAEALPERVNVFYRGRRPDYRDGPLNAALIVLVGVIGLGAVLLLTYGRTP